MYKIANTDKSTKLFALNTIVDSLGKSTISWGDSNKIFFTQLDSNLNTVRQPLAVNVSKPSMEYLCLFNDPGHDLLQFWCENFKASDDVRYNSYIFVQWLSYNGTPMSEKIPIMVDSLSKTGFLDPMMVIKPDGEKIIIWKRKDTLSSKCNYHLQLFTNDMKKIGSPKVIPLNFEEGYIQIVDNRGWAAWTRDSYSLMRNAWSIEELLPVVQRNTTMHQLSTVSNYHFNKNGTNLKLQFNSTALGAGQLNIVQLDGKVIYRQAVTISKPGSQFVNIPLNRKHLPFGTYVLQFQFAGRNYINKFLNVR
jgi:hypothetical protein